MNKWLELLLGLILITAPIYVCATNIGGFGSAALIVLKGGIAWFVLFIGLIFLLLGITDLKS